MKETKQEKQHQDKKTEVAKAEDKKSKRPAEQQTEMLIRILSYDIPGSRNLYAGLTRIKGVSWSISNAICHKLKMDKNKKISELSREEIDKIEDFLSNPDFLDFLKNRRSDPVSGKISHLIGSDLDIAKDFDCPQVGFIPVATNLASGVYELGRKVYCDAKKRVVSRRSENSPLETID